jgi:hypothetical protein
MMMKGIFLLSTVSLASAGTPLAAAEGSLQDVVGTGNFPPETKDALCVLDDSAMEIVSDALDASLYVWAADKRCKTLGDKTKCMVDVWSAISSVNAMVNVILKALDSCNALHTIFSAQDAPCGRSIGVLTKHAAGLVAEGFESKDRCGSQTVAKVNGDTVQAPLMCALDLKDMSKHLYHGVKRILKIKSECQSGGSTRKCVVHALDVAASVAGFGAYISGALGNCERTSAWNKLTLAKVQKDTLPILCAKAALGVAHHSARVASAALAMSKACGVEASMGHPLGQRLYGELNEQDDKKSSNLSSLMVGAFLPISAIVGFVGGRFYANRARHQEARSWMSDEE